MSFSMSQQIAIAVAFGFIIRSLRLVTGLTRMKPTEQGATSHSQNSVLGNLANPNFCVRESAMMGAFGTSIDQETTSITYNSVQH